MNDEVQNQEKVAPQQDQVIAEKSFHDDIINKVFPLIQTVSIVDEDGYSFQDPISRKRRSVSHETEDNIIDDDDEDLVSNETFINIQSQRNGPIKAISETNKTIEGTSYMSRVLVSVSGNINKLTVDKLRHYTDYEIRVFACHKEKTLDKKKMPDVVGDHFRACSDEAILNKKTSFNSSADKIPSWSLDYDFYTLSGNGSEGIIKWFPPHDPNERIVKYMLSRSPDANLNNEFIKCVSLRDVKRGTEMVGGEMREVMTYRLTESGEYYVRLRAVSVFGEGDWTKFQVNIITFWYFFCVGGNVLI